MSDIETWICPLNKDHKMISGDSLSTLFEIAVASEIHSPRKRYSQLPLKATLFNLRKMTELEKPPKLKVSNLVRSTVLFKDHLFLKKN